MNIMFSTYMYNGLESCTGYCSFLLMHVITIYAPNFEKSWKGILLSACLCVCVGGWVGGWMGASVNF